MIVMTTKGSQDCFGGGRRKDYLGFVSFGIFVLVVGIVFVLNPGLISDFQLWIEQMADAEALVRPPPGLIASAIVFFGVIGVSDFFVAGVKAWVEKSGIRALGDVLTGCAILLLAYLLTLYESYAIAGQTVLGLEAIAVGLLIVLYSIVKVAFRK